MHTKKNVGHFWVAHDKKGTMYLRGYMCVPTKMWKPMSRRRVFSIRISPNSRKTRVNAPDYIAYDMCPRQVIWTDAPPARTEEQEK